MKRNSTKLFILALILIASFFSCKKDKACEFNNPLNDLPWLKEIVAELEKDAEAGNKQHARIYQCTYRDGIGFLMEMCVDCPDAGCTLKSCKGTSLCIFGGFAGSTCQEYNIDSESVVLIFEINNRLNSLNE